MNLHGYIKMPEPDHQDALDRIGNEAPVTLYVRKDGNDPATGKPYTGKKYCVSIWDESARKPKAQRFKLLGEAIRFAQDTWSQFQDGTDSAGRVLTQAVLDLVIAEMKGNDRHEQTIHDFSAPILAGIAAGLTNLKDPLIGAKVQKFMDDDYKPKCGFGVRSKPRSRRQQTKLLESWKRLGEKAMKTLPRPWLLRNPFIGLTAEKFKNTKKKPMETIPIEWCPSLVTDEALAMREGFLWAFRLYTSTRASEGNWVRWDHFDFPKKLMYVVGEQDAKDVAEALTLGTEGKRVKYGKYRTLRLTDELIALLLARRPLDGRDGYVFSESIRTRAANNEGKAMRNHLLACGLPESIVEKLTPHDTRSTSACIWAHVLNNKDKLMSHLGHDTEKVTDTYIEKAYEYEVPLEGWKDGQWHLRSAARVNPGYANLPIQDSIPAVGVLPAASDIADEWFVVLPDLTGLTADESSENHVEAMRHGVQG